MNPDVPVQREEEGGEEAVLAAGLAGVIDRALTRHPRGDTFVYGIHQEISPAVVERLRQRYVSSGWSRVTLRAGATGAYMLILTP